MIVADRRLMRALESGARAAFKVLDPAVAQRIEAEIAALETDPEHVMYATATIALAFGIRQTSLGNRTAYGHRGFQGHLQKVGRVRAGNLWDAISVNKSTRVYRTWAAPDDALCALQLAHRIQRAAESGRRPGWARDPQKAIDRRDR